VELLRKLGCTLRKPFIGAGVDRLSLRHIEKALQFAAGLFVWCGQIANGLSEGSDSGDRLLRDRGIIELNTGFTLQFAHRLLKGDTTAAANGCRIHSDQIEYVSDVTPGQTFGDTRSHTSDLMDGSGLQHLVADLCRRCLLAAHLG